MATQYYHVVGHLVTSCASIARQRCKIVLILHVEEICQVHMEQNRGITRLRIFSYSKRTGPGYKINKKIILPPHQCIILISTLVPFLQLILLLPSSLLTLAHVFTILGMGFSNQVTLQPQTNMYLYVFLSD